MILSGEKIYEDYLVIHKAQKNWLIFLIMAPVFFVIGIFCGKIIVGIVIDIIFGIFMLCRSLSAKSALKKVKEGNYKVVRDTVINKQKVHRHQKPSRLYLTTSVIYKYPTDVIPSIYDSVEIGDEFVAVYVGGKILKTYNLNEYQLSSEVLSKIQ